MAFSVSDLKKSVVGNMRYYSGIITTDATSGAVALPGIGVIDAATISPKSATSFYGEIVYNQAAGGSSSDGSLRVVSCTSGDDFYVVAWGH